MAPPLSKIPAGNLFDACLVAASVEGCVEELLNYIYGRDIIDEAGREHKHIGIIMTAGELGKLNIPAQSRTYALMLVESHAYTVARAAESDTRIAYTLLDSLSAGVRIVGIVATVGRESAEILELYLL